jgi:hypothetical protein
VWQRRGLATDWQTHALKQSAQNSTQEEASCADWQTQHSQEEASCADECNEEEASCADWQTHALEKKRGGEAGGGGEAAAKGGGGAGAGAGGGGGGGGGGGDLILKSPPISSLQTKDGNESVTSPRGVHGAPVAGILGVKRDLLSAKRDLGYGAPVADNLGDANESATTSSPKGKKKPLGMAQIEVQHVQNVTLKSLCPDAFTM